MNSEEELGQEIDHALQEKAKKEAGIQEFERRWLQLRESLVAPLFRSAAKVLGTKLDGAKPELFNSSIRLVVGWRGRDYSLTLSPDKPNRMVNCNASIEGFDPEALDLDNLTDAAIRHKILDFSNWIVSGKPSERSVYEDRGPLSP